jgi:hypothetical protein
MRKTGYRLYRNDKKMAKKHDLMENKFLGHVFPILDDASDPLG